MSDAKATAADIEQALRECSQKYHLEFRGGLHIHVHQGAVALYQLSVPTEEVLDFINLSTGSGEYEDVGFPNVQVTKENYRENCGIDNKDSFASLRSFFFETLGDRKWEELVREYAPPLMCSQASGLLHGLIQLGNGIEGFARSNDMMIREGLTWMSNAYFDLSPGKIPLYCHSDTKPEGVRCLDPVSYMIDALEAAKEQQTSAKLREKQLELKGKRVMLMAHKHHPELDFYKALDRGTLVLERDIDTLVRQISIAIAAGALADGPEFFVVHTITGWWALRFVVPYLPDDNARYAAIAHFLRAGVATYIYAFLPGVDETIKLLKVLQSADETQNHPLFQRSDSEPEDANWRQIIDEKARKFSSVPDVEAHHPKAIHALYEDWKKYGYMPVFLEAARNHLKQELYRNYDRYKEAQDRNTEMWNNRTRAFSVARWAPPPHAASVRPAASSVQIRC